MYTFRFYTEPFSRQKKDPFVKKPKFTLNIAHMKVFFNGLFWQKRWNLLQNCRIHPEKTSLLRQYKISVLHIPGNLEQFEKQPPYRSSFFTTADNTINASTLGSTIN